MFKIRRHDGIEVRALAHLVHTAILYIRTMAYRRQAMLDQYFPQADYQEQIRLLADMCDTLVPGLTGNARASLEYTYRSRDLQRQWMVDTLAQEQIDLLPLVRPRSAL